MKKIIPAAAGFVALSMFIPVTAKAHCPLCTVGAGALAVGAAYLGVNSYVVGIFIGAFAIALGLWMARLIKKRYIRYQKPVITALVFASTILPVSPLIQHYTSFNLYLFGDYGSLFNRTYMVNRFLAGSFLGAVIMYVSPFLSAYITRLRKGNLLPYQGICITFLLLIGVSLVMQFGYE